MIRTKSGILGKMIVEMVSKSCATVMRVLASLKHNGEIVYRGNKKRPRRWFKKRELDTKYTKNHLRGDLDCGVVVFTSHIAICEESESVIGVNGRK